jgi:sugar phosphate isomerase/epimerase
MHTRRELGKLGLALLASRAFAKPVNRVNGVWIGIKGFSFRDRSIDEGIAATKELGLDSWEVGFNNIEPAELSGRELRNWRLTVPLEEFRKVRRKFDSNGIALIGFSFPSRKSVTEQEVVRGFEMTKALGLTLMTTSSSVSRAPAMDALASKMKIHVAFHNHSVIKPDEFATPDDFAAALSGRSDYLGINLDVGHFSAAGFDPVSFLEKHHQRIWSIHLKDRKKNQGSDCVFGQGDTPVREILLLLKKNRYDIPAMIEWEGADRDRVADIRKCLDYCRKVLA